MSNEIMNVSFDCVEDLSKYVDSLLFPSGETPASAEFKDSEGNTIKFRLAVTGKVYIRYKGEVYRYPDEFPAELIELIREGTAEYNGADIELNNWFELSYSICDVVGEEIAYDGYVYEADLSKMTPDKLKADLTNYAEYLFSSHEDELKKSNSAEINIDMK